MLHMPYGGQDEKKEGVFAWTLVVGVGLLMGVCVSSESPQLLVVGVMYVRVVGYISRPREDKKEGTTREMKNATTTTRTYPKVQLSFKLLLDIILYIPPSSRGDLLHVYLKKKNRAWVQERLRDSLSTAQAS